MDLRTVKEKEAAWNKVAELFNSNADMTSRSSKQLRQFYTNLKRDTKKAKGEDWLQRYKTGGGPCTKIDVDDTVLSLIEDQIEPSANPYDCDASYYGEKELISVEKSDYSKDRESSENGIVLVVEEQNAGPSTSSVIGYNIRTLGPEFNTSRQASTPTIKESVGADCQSSKHPPTTKTSLCRDNIATLASSRSALCETEMRLIKEKYAHKMRLIDMKIQNEELKREVLCEKLLYIIKKKEGHLLRNKK